MTPNHSLSRIDGLDLARLMAFVGMVIVNFRIVMGAESENGLLRVLCRALEGHAAAAFVVLAGVGLGLAGMRRPKQTVSVTMKRALFLLTLGLLNMTIFEADILHYYAFYFLFGVLLLSYGSRMLVGVLIGLNVVFLILTLSLDYNTGWNWEDYTYAGLWTLDGFLRNLFFNGWHPVFPWFGFLLFGIILSRIALTERRVQFNLIGGGLAAYGVAKVLSSLIGIQLAAISPELETLASTAPIPPMPLYVLSGLGFSCTAIGVCLLISDRLQAIGVLQLLVPAGRQTLTLYLAHILIGMGTLEALDMLDGQSLGQAIGASMLFSIAAVIYAYHWAKHFRHGPIEAVMRRLTG